MKSLSFADLSAMPESKQPGFAKAFLEGKVNTPLRFSEQTPINIEDVKDPNALADMLEKAAAILRGSSDKKQKAALAEVFGTDEDREKKLADVTNAFKQVAAQKEAKKKAAEDKAVKEELRSAGWQLLKESSNGAEYKNSSSDATRLKIENGKTFSITGSGNDVRLPISQLREYLSSGRGII